MSTEPPIPPELWARTPPDVRAAVLALVQSFERRIAALEARLVQDSSNSSRPPSGDLLHVKRRPPRPPSGRRRGGQRGHKRHTRPLVPPERLTAVVDCKPPACRGCSHALHGADPEPMRHQVAEYRLHRLACPGCGVATRGELPAGVPRGAFGPRLQATIALLTGAYRLSERQVRAILADLLGLSVAAGMVAKTERIAAEALAGPVEAVYEHVRVAAAAGVDETGWREGKRRAWPWAAVTEQATAFRIVRSRGADALHALVGPVVVCDRFPTYARAPDRQTCWAHTIRTQSTNRPRALAGIQEQVPRSCYSGTVFDAASRRAGPCLSRTSIAVSVLCVSPRCRTPTRCSTGR